MVGKTLHAFDLKLCHEVVDNVASHLGDHRFLAGFRETVSGPLLAHLLAWRDYDFPQDLFSEAELDAPTKLLLNGQELLSIFSACEWCEEAIPNMMLSWDWTPNPSVYRGYINCLAEIRKRLAGTVADPWANISVAFSEQLESSRLPLHDGIEVIRKWVKELRSLLGAMDASHFLPSPEGEFPTPTTAESASLRKPTTDHEAVKTMREAIAIYEKANAVPPATGCGKTAKADDLIKLVDIRRQRGRDALRYLEAQGEYDGFARKAPTRCRKRL
jgi:hypothetical protein